MTDIVVGVRLNADGSGLVGQVRLSRAELDQFTKSEKGAADAARDLSRATNDASTAQERAVQGARRVSDATAGLTKNVGLQRAGWQQLGFQMQDVFASYASGTRVATIFAQQSGQMASAVALIAQSAEGGKGKLAGLASFLGGPWGIAIGVAVSAASALASAFFSIEKNADKAADAADSFARHQSDLANFIDKTTGKLAEQNKYLLQNAILLRQGKIDASEKAIADNERNAFGIATSTRGSQFVAERQPFATTYDADVEKAITRSGGNQFLLADEMNKLAKSRPDLKSQIAGINTAAASSIFEAQRIRDERQAISFLSGDREIAPGFTPKKDRPKKTRDNSAKEAERLASYSAQAAEAVARLNDEYNIAPRDIDRARQATAQLEAISAEVTRRLESGKNMTAEQREKLVAVKAEAQRLKPVIEQSLVRPILDMITGQERQIALGKLQGAGRQAEAEALQLTYSLMDKMGVESEDQLATALAQRGVTEDQVRSLYDNLDVMREQTREMRVQQELQQMFLAAVGDMRENVRLTIEDLRSEGPRALGDFAKRSVDVLDRLFSEVATEKLFGGLFRDLEGQITGADKVSKAGEKMAKAVGDASGQILDLGKAAAAATALMQGRSAGSGLDLDMGGVRDQAAQEAGEANITVTANAFKMFKGGFQEGFEGFFDDLKGDFKDIFSDIFGDKGVFSKSLGKTLGGLAAGAQTGATAGNLVTGILGIKGSSTGGAIGGALGSAIAGPLGSIVGGTLGSVLGGLTKSTPKASATITGGSDEDVSVSGNKDSLKKASVGLASSVQETLAQIAEEFGGEVGKFAVSIGIRHGDYRVDTTGSGKTKKKKGAIDFDDDQAGAIAYAVMDAITDGGITGISAAVQKALRSSSDLDDALEEALKVKEVETLIGGLGSQLEAQFKAFEKQASERVRIAKEYGFDVLAIEKKNAEDRADLIESLMEDQVGSLQRLIEEMTSGSMFEGSAIEQRDAILTQIAAARADVDAGKDGAADRLAELFQKLYAVSEEAYGSTGQFADDRDMILAQAQAAIDAAQARITAASSATSDPALATTNQALDENNDQNARLIALMESMDARLAAWGVGATSNILSAAALARTS